MTEGHDSSTTGKSAWQTQTLDAPTISLAFIHHQIDKLNKDIRREAVLLYAAFAVYTAAALIALLNPSPTLSVPMGYVYRGGMILALLGGGYFALQMRRHSRTLAHPDRSVQQSLQAYRGELERRRDYHLKSWRWSILPMVPALGVFLIGGPLYDQRPHALRQYLIMALFVVFMTGLAVWNQRRKARTFQQELDAIGTLQRPNS
jgi:hypothetical protein